MGSASTLLAIKLNSKKGRYFHRFAEGDRPPLIGSIRCFGIGVCLVDEKIIEASQAYPFVKKVEVTYDLIRYKWSAEWPFGYHVDITLGSSLEDDEHGTTLYFTVASQLDARQDRDGHPITAGFIPSSEISGPWWWGGNEW